MTNEELIGKLFDDASNQVQRAWDATEDGFLTPDELKEKLKGIFKWTEDRCLYLVTEHLEKKKAENNNAASMGWFCRKCGWIQYSYEPIPELVPASFDCGSYDLLCPVCKGHVVNFTFRICASGTSNMGAEAVLREIVEAIDHATKTGESK